jgi:hypothetical protein
MKLRLGNHAILAYRRLPYRPWYALAEFVDNSTDAYLRAGNRDLLDAAFQNDEAGRLQVEVTYDRDRGLVRIGDNSMGMSLAELEAAMVIGEEPITTAGRSEFGMGMKTAAIWFADRMDIRTKKLGDSNEYRTTIDVLKFAEGDDSLELRTTPKPENLHYTYIELSGLQRRLGVSAMTKTREFLGSIYRHDLRSGLMELTVNGEFVVPPTSKEDDAFLKRSDGSPVVVDVGPMDINGKTVYGWIGVLRPGHTGRNRAGIALIRHGRTVRGWIDSWRPEEIFGDARNDLLNQRVTGELYVDAFKASHTKDAIDWEADEEEILGSKIAKIAKEHDLLRIARSKRGKDDSESDSIDAAEARARLQEQLESSLVIDEIRLLDVPTPERARVATEPLLEATEGSVPTVVASLGNDCSVYLYEIELSPNDPYFEYEVLANADLKVVINSNHPAFDLLSTAEARLAHYHHVLLDAVAEWKCAQQTTPLDSSSIRLMKDRLFRAVNAIDQDLQ